VERQHIILVVEVEEFMLLQIEVVLEVMAVGLLVKQQVVQ
jgi:hypothetical protein